MIRRPLLLLSLPVLLGLGFACSRGAETPAPAPAAGTSDTAGNSASPGSAHPSTAPGTAPGEAPASEPRVDPRQFPEVVARVGKDAITRSDLMNAAQQAAAQAAQAGSAPPPPTITFFHQVLDSLVVRQLLYNDAKAQGITASDADVQRRIAEIKGHFPDPKKFAEALSTQGISEKALADNARTILSVDRFIAEKFAPGIQIAETEVRNFYDTHPDDMKVAERRRVRHILIKPEGPDEAAKEKAKKLAEDLLSRIKKGEDFATLAGQFSADPGSKGSGGELPPFAQGEMVPPFEKAAWALGKGQLSGVVESPFGFHLIQMIDSLPASTVPYDQVRGRIEQYLRQTNLKNAVRARAEQLRAKAKVEVLI